MKLQVFICDLHYSSNCLHKMPENVSKMWLFDFLSLSSILINQTFYVSGLLVAQ